VIAIDDEERYLNQLCKALHDSGIPCVPLKYPDQQPPENGGWFRNVRIMFCDLHLIPSAAGPHQSYGAIGAMLERIIPAGGSPLLLVVWTNYPSEMEALKAYLVERFPADKQPSAILSLSKAEFEGENAAKLPDAIRTRISANPQLSALLEWENDVANAADDCVRMLFRLAAEAGGDFSAAMDVLLSQLACAASGKDLAAENPETAIHEALLPLLSDSVLHLPEDAHRTERWKKAMPSAVAKEKLPSAGARAASINAALNIVHAGAQPSMTARERGAVVRLTDKEFGEAFSRTADEIAKDFALTAKLPPLVWVAIQVEAMCDYAQQKSVRIPYVVALEIPADTALVPTGKGRPDPVWESPAFLSEAGTPVRLVANVRYLFLLSREDARQRKSAYRLRDLLANDLSFAKARHELRPGYIRLD
jgi:hypothetical protein